jgi:integrase
MYACLLVQADAARADADRAILLISHLVDQVIHDLVQFNAIFFGGNVKTRPLSKSECRAILRHLPSERHKVAWMLGCSTGMRISELLSCGPDQFSNQHVHPPALKGGRDRHIWLRPGLYRRVKRMFATQGGSWGFSRTQFWRAIKGAAAGAGMTTERIGTHCMRKSFAMRIYERERSFDLVGLLLGHRSAGSTARYIEFPGQSGVEGIVKRIDFI